MKRNDRGGNVLLFLKHPQCPTVRTRELHFAWDDCMVDATNGAKVCMSHTGPQDVTHLAEILKAEMRSNASEGYKTGGDIHDWTEQWATDTLQVARTHVFRIKLAQGCLIKSGKAPHDPTHVQSRIVAPISKKRYLLSHKEAAKFRLTNALRLAELLNHIAWK